MPAHVKSLTLPLLLAASAALAAPSAAAADDGDESDSGLVSWASGLGESDTAGFKHFTEQAREAKRFGAGLRYGTLLGEPAVGIEGFVNATGNLQLGGELRTTSHNLLAEPNREPLVSLASFHGRSDELLAVARLFFGSSIYVGGGLGLRRARTDWELHEELGDRGGHGQSTTTAAIADARIGSQWAWKSGAYVTLELADWTVAFAGGEHTERRRFGGASDEIDQASRAVEDKAKTWGTSTTAQYLGLAAGVVF